MSRHALIPGAEPFEIAGGRDVGVLLAHGFTGSPLEMRPIADALSPEGIGSYCPLLQGHGTHPDDMVGCSYTDWIDTIERGLDHVLARHDRAVIVGLSMGGTLALNVAARRSDDPRLIGLVTISAPLVLDDWRLKFANMIVKLVKWQAWGKPDIKDRRVWDTHIGYRRIRTRAILESLSLFRETRGLLDRVRQPLLIVHSCEDHVVPPRNADLIRDGVESVDSRVILLDNCYHVSTIDFDAPLVMDEVVRFVQRIASTGGALTHPIAR